MVIRSGQLTRSRRLDRFRPKPNPATSKNCTKTEKSKGLAVIPYVEGLSGRVAGVFRGHGISTAVGPRGTLRSVLVHPGDRLLPHRRGEAVYEVPCAGCPGSCVGETGRSFGALLWGHRRGVERFELGPCARSSRRSSVAEQHGSAVADHVVRADRGIGWGEAGVVDSESGRAAGWVGEAIWVRGGGGRERFGQRRGGIQVGQRL